jgi:prepilin-type N-terminal cleavage/methylation domain-containing protein
MNSFRRIDKRQNRRGFSMVEMLVALTVGAMAFFPIITMLQTGLRTTIHQSYWSQARDLAVKNMDEVLALRYDDIKEGVNQISAVSSFPRSFTIKNVNFNVSVSVRSLSPIFKYRTMNLRKEINPPLLSPPENYTANGEIKEVDIIVVWSPSGRKNNILRFPLRTYRADLHK